MGFLDRRRHEGQRPFVIEAFRTFWFAATATLLLLVAVAVGLSGSALISWSAAGTFLFLTILEVTFSFDNAVVNSKLLIRMSPFWQAVFLTFGILIAVFLVRFALPILIVQITTGNSFLGVVDLALHDSVRYGDELEKAGPLIDSFGGVFLAMIGVAYFLDREKDTHWIGWLERRLAPLGRFDNVGTLILVLVAIVLFFTIPENNATRAAVLAVAVCGIALHMGLDLLSAIFEDEDSTKVLVGMAAFVMFCRLEVLDASFSFDGVIGAFAITSSVVLIMAGLGAGALWVRAMTVHLVRTGTLAKYRYLEHGAHWAILFLGGIMIAKLYHVHLPVAVVGSLGLFFIGFSVISSVRSRRKEERKELEELLSMN